MIEPVAIPHPFDKSRRTVFGQPAETEQRYREALWAAVDEAGPDEAPPKPEGQLLDGAGRMHRDWQTDFRTARRASN